MSLSQLRERLADIAVSLSVLVLLAPVFVMVFALILISNGPPVFFRQSRVGRHGRLFKILKFRTMSAMTAAPAITAASDRRITRLGKNLRRLKLDELPQFINVLRGQMSLIGPRPEVPQFVESGNPLWRKILQVKPGITDMATLFFRNEEEILASAADPEEVYLREILPIKLKLNVRYLAHRTLRTDLLILGLTVLYSLFPRAFSQGQIAGFFGIPEWDPKSALKDSCAAGVNRRLNPPGGGRLFADHDLV